VREEDEEKLEEAIEDEAEEFRLEEAVVLGKETSEVDEVKLETDEGDSCEVVELAELLVDEEPNKVGIGTRRCPVASPSSE
jgi:hypothetical protein